MYLTYSEYISMGGQLSEADYNGFEYEAETRIDWYTFNRLHKEAEYPERVKKCVFVLVENAAKKARLINASLGTETSTTGAAITAQSNDGVSITYNALSASRIYDDLRVETAQTIEMFLTGVCNSAGRHLLYRGVYPDDE